MQLAIPTLAMSLVASFAAAQAPGIQPDGRDNEAPARDTRVMLE